MKTIFALATAEGKAGVAIIRISGDRCHEIYHLITRDSNPPIPRYAKYSKFWNENEVMDTGIVIYFPSPNSFTGEDVIELHIHGSLAIINEVYVFLSSLENVQLAEAGEFTKRAFINGKLDITQCEGLMDLINSKTKEQKKQAERIFNGELRNQFTKWKNQIAELLALLEAYIDFPDEDIPTDIEYRAGLQIRKIISEISEFTHNNMGSKIRSGIRIVIMGRPNVGKSTLMNYLAARNISIVSDIKGTTRDVIETIIDFHGFPIVLFDTAGIRESIDPIEQEGIIRAKNAIKDSDIIISMRDAENEEVIIDQKPHNSFIRVFNKSDACTSFQDNEYIYTSFVNLSGLKTLESEMLLLIKNLINNNSSASISNERHIYILNSCLSSLNSAVNESDLVIKCERYRLALKELGSLTGIIGTEEILGMIFSKFCIGK